jgi:hypothetical protein
VSESLARSVRAMLLLACVMTLLAAFKVGLPFEPQVMSWVYSFESKVPRMMGGSHALHEVPKVRPGEVVTLLELGPQAFELDFNRQSPLDRGCLALALMKLANRLDKVRPPGGFPVVAIDIDVTLDGGEQRGSSMLDVATARPASALDRDAVACLNDPDRIVDALKLLRQHATVIALAVERRTPAQREARNRFMLRMCSQSFHRGGYDPAAKARDGGLYFASSAAFTRATQPAYEAPAELRPWMVPRSPLLIYGTLPRDFPTLGNLLAIARKAHDTGYATAQQQETLTSQCTALHSQVKRVKPIDALVLDDIVLGGLGPLELEDVSTWYAFRPINFLVADVRMREVKLSRLARIDTEPLLSSTIVLSLTDGSTADRFVTPNNDESFTPGAWLHAATAITRESGLSKARTAVKLVADLLAGLVFAILAATIVRLEDSRRHDAPLIHRAATLTLPLVLAVVVVLLGFMLSARLLSLGVWFNPFYMALGMALHVYVDVGTPPHGSPRRESDREDRTAEHAVVLHTTIDEDSEWDGDGQSVSDRTWVQRSRRRMMRVVEWVPIAKIRRRPRRRPITTRLSDWVDVEPPEAPIRRSKVDRWARRVWALFFYLTVACALFVAVYDLVKTQ